uniref:AlNc14C397G11337 protein n=1 Tax=Albugo laibachii Nc14 TaxID=890382 RepID=F0WYS7_9STRA|nr:AlNc14C397G11337 [Albugo laibachii Nc14]|eukprot:CCA26636.1 AlNc14C397G11337 [Albugo laibachii Nc14]
MLTSTLKIETYSIYSLHYLVNTVIQDSIVVPANNDSRFCYRFPGVLCPTHCFQHIHSARQVDFFLHGLAVDVVYTLQQGVKALDDEAILELADLQLELTDDASILWLQIGRRVRQKHVNCHVGKWSVEAIRRHAVKKQKHVLIFCAHFFIGAEIPVLEQLGFIQPFKMLLQSKPSSEVLLPREHRGWRLAPTKSSGSLRGPSALRATATVMRFFMFESRC